MANKKNKATNNGNKKGEISKTSKENHLSEESQRFLKFSMFLFGDLLTAFIEKRMKDLSKEKQYDLVWHILHYMHSEEILPTGNPLVDIKLSEIIEVLPVINIELFRYMSREKFGIIKKTSEASQYTN